MRTTSRTMVVLAIAPALTLLMQSHAHAVDLEYEAPTLTLSGVGTESELTWTTGAVSRSVTWTATVPLGTEDNGVYPAYTQQSQTGSCASTSPSDPNTRTSPTSSATAYDAVHEQAWYLVRYLKLDASRTSSGAKRFHVLGCVFGNAKTLNGKRMTRAMTAYAAYVASSPSQAYLLGVPKWDTYIDDSKANATLSVGATSGNYTVGVEMPVNRNVGHLSGNYGISGPHAMAADSYSLVNTTHAWWQNNCPGGVSCGVKSTRGAVLEAVHAFTYGTTYTWVLGGSIKYRG